MEQIQNKKGKEGETTNPSLSSMRKKSRNRFNFAVAILTCGRKSVLEELLNELRPLQENGVEIIVVDNGSRDGTGEMVKEQFPAYKLIPLEGNIGVAGRNRALEETKRDLIITLDDDILGMTPSALENIGTIFENHENLGALCFKVKDFYSGKVCNWCHPNRPDEFSGRYFETTEISEGAVVLRAKTLQETGLYPEEFFISHEGADLAARIMDKGYEIHYSPEIVVRHKYATASRDGWRRYYYDMRNSIWLAVRNYRLIYGLQYVLKRLVVMGFYSLRDGHLSVWFKAVKDGVKGISKAKKNRKPIGEKTEKKIKELSKSKPGLLFYVRNRIFSRKVRI